MSPFFLLYLAVLPLLSSSQSILSSRQSDSDDTSSSSPRTSSTTYQGHGACMDPMCITATVTDNNINYRLTSTGQYPVGYMAMGWGTQMVGSDMVIMWANANGNITLSQRKASAHEEPSVQDAPSVRATLSQTLFGTEIGNGTVFAFTVPYASEGQVDLIWSFSSTVPRSAEVDASIVHHLYSGVISLDLSLTGDTDPHSISHSAPLGDNTRSPRPFTSYEKMMVAHAILCTLGFIVFLPIGALLARFLRTFSNEWFIGHQSIQLYLAGILIVVGVILGYVATEQAGDSHFSDTHKRFGVALIVLYLVQITLGFVAHTFKPTSGQRPPQNYIHAIIGLTIIGGAFYQVRYGYKEEFPAFTGREVSGAANIVWIVWVSIVSVAYVAGLILLRRQFKKEKEVEPHKEQQ